MANQEQLDILIKGVEAWNAWRDNHRDELVDFSKVDFNDADFGIRQNTSRASNRLGQSTSDPKGINLHGVNFSKVKLNGVNLNRANLSEADLSQADLMDADLRDAELQEADIDGTNLCRADLTGAKLNNAQLVGANVSQAKISGSFVYGIGVWDLKGEFAEQKDLVITPEGASVVTVDNVKIAQFIYLILNNSEIRDAIDTIGKKAVLILGRFTEQRKSILDAIREELRKSNYLPILFDFEKPESRDLTETIVTLAHMARFIIADITEAKSIPQELQAIVPNLPSVPVKPIISHLDKEFAMFEHFRHFPWVLSLYPYEDRSQLLAALDQEIIQPLEKKASELQS